MDKAYKGTPGNYTPFIYRLYSDLSGYKYVGRVRFNYAFLPFKATAYTKVLIAATFGGDRRMFTEKHKNILTHIKNAIDNP